MSRYQIAFLAVLQLYEGSVTLVALRVREERAVDRACGVCWLTDQFQRPVQARRRAGGRRRPCRGTPLASGAARVSMASCARSQPDSMRWPVLLVCTRLARASRRSRCAGDGAAETRTRRASAISAACRSPRLARRGCVEMGRSFSAERRVLQGQAVYGVVAQVHHAQVPIVSEQLQDWSRLRAGSQGWGIRTLYAI